MRSRSVVAGAVSGRRLLQAGADAAAWAGAVLLVDLARDPAVAGGTVALAGAAALLQVGVGTATSLYRGRYRYASFDEIGGLLRTSAFTAAVLVLLVVLVADPGRPAWSAALAWGVAVTAAAGARWCGRTALERRLRPGRHGAVERLLVFGAGEGGAQAVVALLRDPRSPYLPVALLDDDPSLRNLRLAGVPVVGGREQIAAAARTHGAGTLLIAVPSAEAAVVREVADLAEAAGLAVKVLPTVQDLPDAVVRTGDIRDLQLEDLLGRRPVQTDVDGIARYLAGKRVLVTGAGGSIGSELCRALRHYDLAELIMLDRDESALHAVQLSLDGTALLDGAEVVLADIRDEAHVLRIFEQRQPDVVFHAAALKHLPLLEQYPEEALKTNVWGTQAVLRAAAAVGAERVINISTDKAADPISVLGFSKRAAERLTAHMSATTGIPMVSVRFGNVLGSRGSVLTTFARQAEEGLPMTVTAPDVTRYFMTVQEAVELVIQAGAIGRGGEVLVLDMGEPVRIAEVAERIASRSGRDPQIRYTGLRRGEKLHEDLLAADEQGTRHRHPLITHVAAPPLDPSSTRGIDAGAPRSLVVDGLRALTGLVERRQARAPGERRQARGTADVPAPRDRRQALRRRSDTDTELTPVQDGDTSPVSARE